MSIIEITDKVNELASSWEQFKLVNERRLTELEKKGSADPLTLNHLEKLNNAIDMYQDKVHRLETALCRPGTEVAPEFGSVNMREYKKAFCEYLRKGKEGNLPELEKKALSVSQNSDGGYLVTHHMSDIMVKMMHDLSPIRQIAKVVQIATDALELIEDKDEAYAGWTQETEPREETATPQLGKKVIPVHELYAQPKATQKLIDDSSIDIESWLSEKLVEVFSRKENAAFINGDGDGKPRGILSYKAGTNWEQIEQISSGQAGTVTVESLFNLYFSLKEAYAVSAKFIMSRPVLQAIRILKNPSTGVYLWQPALNASNPDTLLGSAVMQCADMPGIAEGNLAVAFGDFKSAYQIVDRQGVRMMRDPFTEKPFVNFYTTKRVGGDVVNFEALKLLRIAGK